MKRVGRASTTELPWAPELAAAEAKRRTEVEEALLAARGNIMRTAAALGVPRPTLRHWLEEYKLVEAAAELRREAGQGVGRPRKP